MATSEIQPTAVGTRLLRKVICPMPGCATKPMVPCTYDGTRWTIVPAVLIAHLAEHGT